MEEITIHQKFFEYKQNVYQCYIIIYRSLKQQIENSVEPAYIETPKNELSAFSTLTALEKISHIYQTYSDIKDLTLKITTSK